MIRIEGKFNTAAVYTNVLEDTAREQIRTMVNSEIFAGSRIAIMPDVHAGAGCTIGTTMTLTDKVIPNMVGVDIGCGMEVVRIKEKEIDFAKLDQIIHDSIPAGRAIRSTKHANASQIELTKLRCYDKIRNIEEEYKAIGTLGGGNHFIEVDQDEQGCFYIVIHSGSRHLGKAVAEYYQDSAYKQCSDLFFSDQQKLITRLKSEGREKEIQSELAKLKSETILPKESAYCSGKLFEDYLHDMKIMQKFAQINRKTMMEIILSSMNFTSVEEFTTIHNYIDTKHHILRKGAVSASKGEKLIIPINMKEGSLICIGKGNKEWNCSAPHGAGRICGRKEAKKRFSVEEFLKEMEGIYSTTMNESTLDECPMAYKNKEEIISNIEPTAKIISIIRPVYNFKAED